MRLKFESEIQKFLEVVSAPLSTEPSVHSFITSLAGRYQNEGKKILLLSRGETENGKFLIAGIQTDAVHDLILSKAGVETTKAFASSSLQQNIKLPGTTGPAPGVDAFAETWSRGTNTQAREVTHLLLHEL